MVMRLRCNHNYDKILESDLQSLPCCMKILRVFIFADDCPRPEKKDPAEKQSRKIERRKNLLPSVQ